MPAVSPVAILPGLSHLHWPNLTGKRFSALLTPKGGCENQMRQQKRNGWVAGRSVQALR